MDAIMSRIGKGNGAASLQVKMVSIAHLSRSTGCSGKLVRRERSVEKLYSGWHFYLDSNKNFPEAKTMIIVAMPHLSPGSASDIREQIILRMFRRNISRNRMILPWKHSKRGIGDYGI